MFQGSCVDVIGPITYQSQMKFPWSRTIVKMLIQMCLCKAISENNKNFVYDKNKIIKRNKDILFTRSDVSEKEKEAK